MNSMLDAFWSRISEETGYSYTVGENAAVFDVPDCDYVFKVAWFPADDSYVVDNFRVACCENGKTVNSPLGTLRVAFNAVVFECDIANPSTDPEKTVAEISNHMCGTRAILNVD